MYFSTRLGNLSAPEIPISIKAHPGEIFSGTSKREHTVCISIHQLNNISDVRFHYIYIDDI